MTKRENLIAIVVLVFALGLVVAVFVLSLSLKKTGDEYQYYYLQ